MSEAKPEVKPWKKLLCPYLLREPFAACLGPACAVYIRVRKPVTMTDGKYESVSPNSYYFYEGCGLVRVVPWERIRINYSEKTEKETESKDE